MRKITDILGEAPALKSIVKSMDSALLIRKHWPDILGKWATKVRFSHLDESVIVALVPHHGFMTELRFFEKMLLQKANAMLKRKKVSGFRFEFGAQVSVVQPRRDRSLAPGLTFEQKVKEMNRRREAAGYRLCPTCEAYWISPGSRCVQLACQRSSDPLQLVGH